MKKWIVMLAMLSLLTACAQAPEPESAELTELSAATSESAEAEETPAPISTAEPTATPTATPEPAEAKPTMVYIANSGTKYHRLPSCSGMENPTEVTLEQAESWGYTPCKRCY